MATYPALPTEYRSDPQPITRLAIDRAEDGTARGRAYHAADKVKIKVIHPLLTAADKATLDAFYATNRLIQFDYEAIDGVTRSMLFAAPIQYERHPGSRWTASVDMEQA